MPMLTRREKNWFDGLRQIGDPALERALGPLALDDCAAYLRLVYLGGPAACDQLDEISDQINGAPVITPTQKGTVRTWWAKTLALGLPDPMPWHELDRTRELFQDYGTDIASALLLSALPEAYAAGWGARILAATGQLQNDQPGSLRRRIRATAQFVMLVLGPSKIVDAWDPKTGPAFHAVMGLRLFHQVIRTILRSKATRPGDPAWDVLGPENTSPNVPLNQEDLLATQLTFTVTVFEVLEKFGLSWTRGDQEAYLTTWGLIGTCLGIPPWRSELWNTPDWATPDPRTVRGARWLLNLLRDRQWAEVEPFAPEGPPAAGPGAPSLQQQWDSLRPGRLLTKALLDELTISMPDRTKAWPVEAIRQLTPDVVRDRLGLGSNGLALTILDGLPQRLVPVARFTRLSLPNPAKGRVLRTMANRVTRNTVIAFLQSSEGPPFVVPGLEDWSKAIRAR